MKHALTIMAAVSIPLIALADNRPVGRHFATRSEVIAREGMAATSHPLATQVALDILKKGGTAVDAAIAANALLGLVEPTGCGVGGDLFAIVWDAKAKRLHGLNASGRSPGGLTPGHFKERGLDKVPPDGPLSVTIPGCVDGWFELHGKFGALPMADLLAPAIRYADDGFPVSEVIADEWVRHAPKFEKYPEFKALYMPGGRAPATGEIFRNPGLARTLERIARGGRDGFYKGETARVMAAHVREQGGFLSEQDLAAHRSEWVEPVSTNYRGYDVWELPPNGQGIAVLQMLNILEGYDIAKMGFGSREHVHLFVEAKKLAFEDRAKFYADPAFNQLPVRQLISKDYAAKRRALIDPDKPAMRLDAGDPALVTGDTIYLTVADRHGNMVSLIQSIFWVFGSGVTPPGLGFYLQNRGHGFSLQEGHFNAYAPGKRPFHTIIPAFVTKKGEPFLSFGVMGGAMQPQGHVQVLLNLIDFGMNLQEAGDAPRIQHVGSSEPTGETMTTGGEVLLEHGFPEETVRDLVKMGHKVGKGMPGTFGGYQAIQWDKSNRVYRGASESRKDGQAGGY